MTHDNFAVTRYSFVHRDSELAQMTEKELYTGGCLCGAIRFEAKAPAMRPHACSCKMCQRHSGAVSTLWVEFPKDSVTWIGEDGEPAKYWSSEKSSRAFCPKCGSTLGSIDDAPVVALLIGVLDNMNSVRLIPASHSFSDGLPCWWHFEYGND